MAKGPDGQERPGEAIGCAVKVAKLATGEITESQTPAQEIARQGGRARALKLSAKRRKEISKSGAAARWGIPLAK